MAAIRDRLIALDAVRGCAVMGILALNVVDFALPSYAYIDPGYYGKDTAANWWTWAICFVLFDGKMRGLFTILFGASVALVVSRAETAGANGAKVHFARMAVLLAFGMIHAWLIWSGDILVLYAICGAFLYALLPLRTRALLTIAATLLLLKLAVGLGEYEAARRFEVRAHAPTASADLRREWATFRDSLASPPSHAAADLAAYRGDFSSVQRARAATTASMQTQVLPTMLTDTIALMIVGVALFRIGFFAGTWPRRGYATAALFGLVTIAPYVAIVAWLDRSRFDPVVQIASEPLHLVLLRPWLSIGYAAAIILFAVRMHGHSFIAHLAATGRMAFSNYLGTSIACTAIFYGYGLGWYGWLERWQLYPIVLAIWATIMIGSKWWLDRFAYGPMEWLWRSLARWQVQPFRRSCEPHAKSLANVSQYP